MVTKEGLNRVEFKNISVTTIVNWTRTESSLVKGLTLDIVKKHVYFTYSNNLFRCNYDGTKLHRISYFEKVLNKPSLLFFNSTMTVLDLSSRGFVKLFKKNLRHFLYRTDNKTFEEIPIPKALNSSRYIHILQGFTKHFN